MPKIVPTTTADTLKIPIHTKGLVTQSFTTPCPHPCARAAEIDLSAGLKPAVFPQLALVYMGQSYPGKTLYAPISIFHQQFPPTRLVVAYGGPNP